MYLHTCILSEEMCLLIQVTVFSTSEKKKEEALKTLKADHFIVSKNEKEMQVSFCCAACYVSYQIMPSALQSQHLHCQHSHRHGKTAHESMLV